MPDDDTLAKLGTAALGNCHNAEPAVRFGVGARHYYGDAEWTEDLEERMRRERHETNAPDAWDHVRDVVKRGWHRLLK